MAYQKDNGSFWGGFLAAFLVVIAFICGYRLRDLNYTFNLTQPPTTQDVQKHDQH
jgi:hypothetical protein